MNNGFRATFAFLFMLCISGQGETLAAPVMPGVVLRVLPNGLRLLVREQHSAPLVAVDVWVRAGSGREEAGESGAAHFLEHLLFKGTASRKPGEIDAAIEDLGATLAAFTSRDSAHFATTVPSAHAQTAIVVLADALQNSTLDPTEMERERAVILDEIARSRNDTHKDVVNRLLAQRLGPRAYGRPMLGLPESIRTISRETVAAFYRRWYTPGNATLVVVGDISPDRAEELAKAAFGSWSGSSPTVQGGQAVQAGVPPGGENPAVSALAPGVPAGKEVAAVGFVIPRGKDGVELSSGFVAAALLQNAVRNRFAGAEANQPARGAAGQTRDGISGPMDISGEFSPQFEHSLLTLTAVVASGAGGELVKAVDAEVDRLRKEPPSAQELDAAVRQVVGPYLYEIETYGGQASALGMYDVLSDYTEAQKLVDRLVGLKPGDLPAIMQRLVLGENRVETLLTPPAKP